MIIEMSPEVLTADYVGEPGRRVFYLQGREGGRLVTLLLEKEQVAVLAERLRELLLTVDAADTITRAVPGRDPGLGLEQPIQTEARVAALAIAFLEDEDRVVIAAEPAGGDDDEEGIEYRFLLRRDQVRALVLHALAVVREGRPLCQLCGLPIDRDGHACPATNGHRPG